MAAGALGLVAGALDLAAGALALAAGAFGFSVWISRPSAQTPIDTSGNVPAHMSAE